MRRGRRRGSGRGGGWGVLHQRRATVRVAVTLLCPCIVVGRLVGWLAGWLAWGPCATGRYDPGSAGWGHPGGGRFAGHEGFSGEAR